MSTELNDYQLGPIFLVSLVVILAATDVGRWLGVRAGDKWGDEVLTLQSACLGLLALMIAFTFAMALSRFEGGRRTWSMRPAFVLLPAATPPGVRLACVPWVYGESIA
jgi:hypothetical protein